MVEFLVDNLKKTDYIWSIKTDKDNTITGLFFAHQQSVELGVYYHYVIQMDLTYKTKIYKYPLLHIVGITSTQKTFTLAYCFLKFENTEYYSWVLTQLQMIWLLS